VQCEDVPNSVDGDVSVGPNWAPNKNGGACEIVDCYPRLVGSNDRAETRHDDESCFGGQLVEGQHAVVVDVGSHLMLDEVFGDDCEPLGPGFDSLVSVTFVGRKFLFQ